MGAVGLRLRQNTCTGQVPKQRGSELLEDKGVRVKVSLGVRQGSAWHHSFPPFDLDTLMASCLALAADLRARKAWCKLQNGTQELHGGRDKLTQKLDELFTVPANFKTGSYKDVRCTKSIVPHW